MQSQETLQRFCGKRNWTAGRGLDLKAAWQRRIVNAGGLSTSPFVPDDPDLRTVSSIPRSGFGCGQGAVEFREFLDPVELSGDFLGVSDEQQRNIVLATRIS